MIAQTIHASHYFQLFMAGWFVICLIMLALVAWDNKRHSEGGASS